MQVESGIKYIGLVVFVLMAVLEVGHIHPDEHFQLIEFAQYQLGRASADDLPWEFHEQMRPTLQVWMVVGIIQVLGFLHVENPFTITLILRLFTAVAYWLVISRFNRLLIEQHVPKGEFSMLFQLSTYLIWFVPFANAHFTSESFSAIFLLLGIHPLIRDPNGRKGLLGAGVSLGIAFLFRYQVGIAVAGVYLWLLMVARIPIGRILESGILCVGVIALGSGLDSLFYGQPVFAPWNYLKLNLVDGKASEFGTDPWYFYFTRFALSRPVIGIVLLVFFAKGLFVLRRHLFVWVIVPFVMVHSLIAHKEMRFLFPIIYPFIFVCFRGFLSFFKGLSLRKYQVGLFRAFLGANVIIIVLVMLMPDQIVMTYRYLYENRDKVDGNIISVGKSYYDEMAHLKSTFYTPPDVRLMVADENDLSGCLSRNRAREAFLIQDEEEIDVVVDGYSVQRAYSAYPDWLVDALRSVGRDSLNRHTVFLIRKEGRMVE